MGGEPEAQILTEYYKNVNGVQIYTKTTESNCPLGFLVSKSGIAQTFPQFQISLLEPELGSTDLQMVATGGDTTNMNELSVPFGDWSNGFSIIHENGFISIGLPTYYWDSQSRPTMLYAGLRGIKQPDLMLGFGIFTHMFPSLTFRQLESEPSYEEQQALASQNIVPIPVLRLTS